MWNLIDSLKKNYGTKFFLNFPDPHYGAATAAVLLGILASHGKAGKQSPKRG